MPSNYYSPPSYYGPQRQGQDHISQLLLEQGRAAAEGAERSGQIWGNTLAGLGQQIGGAVQQYGEQKEQSRRSKAFDAALASGDPTQIIKVLGPKDGPAVVTALQAHSKDGMKQYGDRMTLIRDQARGVLAVPPENRKQAYDFAINGLVQNGVIKREEVPEYDEPTLKQLASYGAEQAKPKGPMEVSAGASLVDPEHPEKGSLFTAPKPVAPPSPHVVGRALVGDEGKVIYRDPDSPKGPAEPKWQQGEDENGDPILYDVATGAVKPFPKGVIPKAGAAEAGRIAGAKAALEASSEIKQYLSRPEVRKAVGPMIGRYNSIAQAAGVGDPVAVELVGMLKSYAAMQPNIHGFRAVHFAADIEKLLSTKQTPESLEAALRGIDTAAINVRDRGRHPEGAKPANADPLGLR